MKKIGIVLIGIALFGCVPAISASPPARDVGTVILVDDQPSASLKSLAEQINIELRAELLQMSAVLETAPATVVSFEKPLSSVTVLNLVTPEAELEAVAAIRVSCEALLICKSNKFIKEKIYLTGCSIRQC
jgi:hypothetical protein